MAFAIYMGLSWRLIPVIILLLSIVLLIKTLKMPIPETTDVHRDVENKNKVFKNARYYLFMLILFLYVGSENSINIWLVTYLDNMEMMAPAVSQYFLSFFWLVIIIGRFIVGRVSGKIKSEVILFIGGTGGMISFYMFLVYPQPYLKFVFIIVLGLCFAGIFPTTVANANYTIKGNSLAIGIFLSFGGMGGAVVPWINGIVADKGGINASMVVTAVSCGLLAFAAFINVIVGKRQKKQLFE